VIWKPRDKAAYAHALLALLPLGEIWTRTHESTLVRTITALAAVVERWAARTAQFLILEAFPPDANALLDDWERVLGLPDPCVQSVLTVAERRVAIREKLARRPGSLDRAYYIGIARRLGYHIDGPAPSDLQAELGFTVGALPQVTIREFSPFMAGVSRCGATLMPGSQDAPRWQIGSHAQRFFWRVRVPGQRLTWFRCGQDGGRAGRDTHLRIRRADDLECAIRRLAPAHTVLIFNYQGA
jgi:uncharacterized protein YmfQ (DUF2313 family)